jgi:parallel beta-helix repeat protein
VDGNTFFDLGAGAIRIGEQKVAATDADIAKDNAFTDNEVHDIGLVYPSTVAIWVGQSSGNNLSHNHLYRMPYTAISVGWTWGYGKSTADHTKIEFNNIHDIGSMLSDLGAVYLLGMQPGTVVRNNLIHNVSTFTYGGWGIYLDEGTSNVVVENNIVYDTQSSGFHQHYGRDNMMRNNIFAFGTNYQIMRTRPETTLAFTFDHNIILYDQGSLLGYSWVGSGTGYKMDHNIYYDLRGKAPMFADMTWAQWQEKGNDPHSAVVDPQFVDPLSFDFRLKPGSPALKMGFRQIDMRTVGPQPRGVGRVAK